MQSQDGPSVQPPYVAVIFTSLRTHQHDQEYAKTSHRMESLAHAQPGFLGMESVRGPDGDGITISYWKDRDSARRWKNVVEHRQAQAAGRDRFYQWYRVRIAEVQEEYAYSIEPPSNQG